MGKSQNAGALKHDLKLPLGCVYNLYMKGKWISYMVWVPIPKIWSLNSFMQKKKKKN
jgi:hypothetical protein